jgi:hypothetical protein
VAQLQGSSFTGTDVTIRSNYLTVPNLSTDFANNDNWVVDSTSVNYWIEAGIIHGTYCCNNYAASPSFFWADSRPNGGGFHSHQGGGASLNTYYDDFIYYQGGGNWYVDVGGFTGNSLSNITTAKFIETGTEVTVQSATVCSSQSHLSYYDQNGLSHSGWSDATHGNATLFQSRPPYAYWGSIPNWLRDYDNTSC